MIVLWDTISCTPQLKISQPHKHGVASMDICSQAGLLVTLSETSGEGVPQEISLWDLSAGETCTNLITVPVPAGDMQVLTTDPLARVPSHWCMGTQWVRACCVFVLESRFPTRLFVPVRSFVLQQLDGSQVPNTCYNLNAPA